MSFLKNVGYLVLIFSIGISVFYQYSIEECKHFKIESQVGKVFIVTGANSGLGFVTTRDLAAAGGTVIMAVRNLEKGEQAKKLILSHSPSAKLEVMLLDLSSFSSIRNFAKNFQEKYGHVDVLINNAGVMALATREVTKDGLEQQVGANHFGHFLLTSLIFPLINQNGRIIVHSSTAHIPAATGVSTESIRNDFQSVVKYDPWVAYGNSKAANLLFTYEMNKRLKVSNPKNIICIAVHPGYSDTNLQTGRSFGKDIFKLELMNVIFAMPAEYGAQGQTLAAVSPSLGPSFRSYVGPRFTVWGAPRVMATEEYVWNESLWSELWEVSLKVTGAQEFL